MILYTTQYFNWQQPVITEKYVFQLLEKQNSFSNNYFHYIAFPWAQILDELNKQDNAESLIKFNRNIQSLLSLDLNSQQFIFTACQSYNYKKLLPLFEKLCLNTFFIPHATKYDAINIYDTYGIEILPFPLYPINKVRALNRKTLFYSFIGNVHYKGGRGIG